MACNNALNKHKLESLGIVIGGCNQKRQRSLETSEASLSRNSSVSRHSELACKALGVVLQHWMVPELDIRTQNLENYLEPLRSQLVSKAPSVKTTKSAARKQLAEEVIRKNLIQRWQSSFDLNRISTLSAELLSFDITELAPPEFQQDHPQNNNLDWISAGPKIREIMRSIHETRWEEISLSLEHYAICAILDLKDAYFHLHHTLCTFLTSQQDRWGKKTNEEGSSYSSLVVHQLVMYSKWQKINRPIELSLISLSLVPRILRKERDAFDSIYLIMQHSEDESLMETFESCVSNLLMRLLTNINVITRTTVSNCYHGMFDMIHNLASQIQVAININRNREHTSSLPEWQIQHERSVSSVCYNMQRYVKDLHETWFRQCITLHDTYAENLIRVDMIAADSDSMALYLSPSDEQTKTIQYPYRVIYHEAVVLSNLTSSMNEIFDTINPNPTIHDEDNDNHHAFNILKENHSPYRLISSSYHSIVEYLSEMIPTLGKTTRNQNSMTILTNHIDRVIGELHRINNYSYEVLAITKRLESMSYNVFDKQTRIIIKKKVHFIEDFVRFGYAYISLLVGQSRLQLPIDRMNQIREHYGFYYDQFITVLNCIDSIQQFVEHNGLILTVNLSHSPLLLLDFYSSDNVPSWTLESLDFQLLQTACALYSKILPSSENMDTGFTSSKHSDYLTETFQHALQAINIAIEVVRCRDQSKWYIEDSNISEFVMIQQLIAWSYIKLMKKIIKLLDNYCEDSEETFITIVNNRKVLTEKLHNAAMIWLNSLESKSDHAKTQVDYYHQSIAKAVLFHTLVSINNAFVIPRKTANEDDGKKHEDVDEMISQFDEQTRSYHSTVLECSDHVVQSFISSILPVMKEEKLMLQLEKDQQSDKSKEITRIQYYAECGFWLEKSCQVWLLRNEIKRKLIHLQQKSDKEEDSDSDGSDTDDSDSDDSSEDCSDEESDEGDMNEGEDVSEEDEEGDNIEGSEASYNAAEQSQSFMILNQSYENCLSSCEFIGKQCAKFQEMEQRIGGNSVKIRPSSSDVEAVVRFLTEKIDHSEQKKLYLQASSEDKPSVVQAFRSFSNNVCSNATF